MCSTSRELINAPCCQVVMQHWMEANFGSVAAMYEDRHQLWGFNHKGRLLQRSLPARTAQVRMCPRLLALVQFYSIVLPDIQLFMVERGAADLLLKVQHVQSLQLLVQASVVTWSVIGAWRLGYVRCAELSGWNQIVSSGAFDRDSCPAGAR